MNSLDKPEEDPLETGSLDDLPEMVGAFRYIERKLRALRRKPVKKTLEPVEEEIREFSEGLREVFEEASRIAVYDEAGACQFALDAIFGPDRYRVQEDEEEEDDE